MDLFRKIGIGIVMIVPTFVFGGLIFHLLHSWLAVLVWMIIMVFASRAIMTGKLTSTFQRT